MYDIMTEEESFLKCLCKSIIEFLICNFSWKWPCSNKSSQITEYQTLSASCLFTTVKVCSATSGSSHFKCSLKKKKKKKNEKVGIFLLSYPVCEENTEDDSTAAHYYVNFTFKSHFQINQTELTSALQLIMSHLDDKVKPNMHSTSFHYLSWTFF